MITEVELGKRLRKARRKKSLSLESAAEQMPCSYSVLSAYERGLRFPRLHFFLRMCEVYDVTPNELLERKM